MSRSETAITKWNPIIVLPPTTSFVNYMHWYLVARHLVPLSNNEIHKSQANWFEEINVLFETFYIVWSFNRSRMQLMQVTYQENCDKHLKRACKWTPCYFLFYFIQLSLWIPSLFFVMCCSKYFHRGSCRSRTQHLSYHCDKYLDLVVCTLNFVIHSGCLYLINSRDKHLDKYVITRPWPDLFLICAYTQSLNTCSNTW